jgi:hypothetical protein
MEQGEMGKGENIREMGGKEEGGGGQEGERRERGNEGMKVGQGRRRTRA